jgi:Na+/phosphate symporter
VERRLRRRLPYEVYKNLSRLSSQWADRVSVAILNAEKEFERQMDVLVGTLDRLLSRTRDESPQIEENLRRVNEFLSALTYRTHEIVRIQNQQYETSART